MAAVQAEDVRASLLFVGDLRRFPNHLFMLTPGNTDWGYTE